MLIKKEKEEIKKQASIINDIANNKYAEKLKQNAKNNTKNALIGGAVGVVLALASRNNVYLGGIIGFVIGSLVLTKKNI